MGLYSPALKRVFWSRNLSKSEIKKPGYNWYKLGTANLSGDSYMFFFKHWHLKLGVLSPFDMNEPDRKFDIWLRLKFTGP